MNKQQKIALIRQYLSGADLSESRCYILEVGEVLPADYRKGTDRIIWVYALSEMEEPEIKKSKNDMVIGVTSKETVQAVKKLGDYLDKQTPMFEPDPTAKPQPVQAPPPPPAPPFEPAAIPPAAIPIQPRMIRNPNYGYRKSHF